MQKLLFSFAIITLGLSLGYLIQQFERRGVIRLPMPIAVLRKRLQQLGLMFFLATSFGLALWILRIPDMRLMALPFIGLCALVMGGGLGLLASRLFGHTRQQAGAMFGCGSFTNIGALGSMVSLVFLGEEGFAMVALYKLFEETYYYALAFPIAKYHGPMGNNGETLGTRLRAVFTDPFVVTILGALVVGSVLNVAGVPRPAFLGTVNSIFVPTGTFVLLLSIGLAMRFSSARQYLRECAAAMGIKFLVTPCFAVGAAYLLGMGDILGGLPLKVVLICSSMPVAFNALIPPSIYDLDLDLANGCWLATTLSLAWVLPLLYFLLQTI